MSKPIYSLLILLAACNSAGEPEPDPNPAYTGPSPGTLILSDSSRLPDDLNEQYFKVELTAGDSVHKGTYNVLVSYGWNDAIGSLTFPGNGDPKLRPAIRKASEHDYIIGFYYDGDTSFHDYFLIRATRHTTEMKYIKAYTLE